MASDVEICNLAISHLGEGKEIQNLETEDSEEATVCRRFFEIARDETLEDFRWPFATRIIALGLIEEDPNDFYKYSYRYPSDALIVRRIFSSLRNDNRQSVVHYKIASDATSKIIFTDCEDAVIEYSTRITDPNYFSTAFIIALSYKLAGYIAPRILAGDPFGMINRVNNAYTEKIIKAETNVSNEEQAEDSTLSEFERGRN